MLLLGNLLFFKERSQIGLVHSTLLELVLGVPEEWFNYMLGPRCEEITAFEIFGSTLSSAGNGRIYRQLALAQCPADSQSRTKLGAGGLKIRRRMKSTAS